MSTGCAVKFEIPTTERSSVPIAGALADYWTLTKPDVNLLILIATFAGFCLARPDQWYTFLTLRAFHLLLGTLLVAGVLVR